MWQVAELPLNFPDASQDSQAENQVLLSSLRFALEISSLTLGRLQVQGYKCWQAGSQLE